MTGRATRVRRRLNRVLWSIWTTRVTYAVSCAFYLYLIVTADNLWWRLGETAFLLLLLAVLAHAEYRHRLTTRLRWETAAERPDPVLYLARDDFQKGLSMRESMQLANWHVDHLVEGQGRPPTPEEIAAAPPVVQEYYAIGTNPQEQP